MAIRAQTRVELIGPEQSKLCCVLRVPQSGLKACVLLLPPFGEEMNKSRRLLSLVAQSLAARGFASALVDLHGTGDSDGEFADATWARWLDDGSRVLAWCTARIGPVTAMLGVRLGCALAAGLAARSTQPLQSSVYLQPVPDGSRMLDQFLRLRVAASLMDADSRESVAGLRSQLAAGATIEVAGYELSPKLADDIDQIRLPAIVDRGSGSIHWIETVREPGASPSQASVDTVARLTARGLNAELIAVPCDPFWSSTEIVAPPALANAVANCVGAAA